MQRPRSFRTRRWWASAGLALLPAAAHAAVYVPGTAPADPPTGDAGSGALRGPAPPAQPPAGSPVAGNGIRWEFAPWRSEGSLTVDTRWLRLEDGRRSTQGLVFGDMDFASYVWQPWFIQVRAGLGLLAGRDGGTGQGSNTSGSATGRLQVSVFPASRFPFELRADISDSRTRGDTLGADYRSARVSVDQSWRPETGNDSVTVHLDHSRLQSDTAGTDTLTALNAVALRQGAQHTLEVNGSWSLNETSESDDRTRLATLAGRHSFHPRNNLVVETLASWNEAALEAAGTGLTSGVRQVSSFATWRPAAGEPLYRADAPLTLAGSARWVQAETGDDTGSNRVQAFNATLGANQDLSRDWRLSASLAAGRFGGGGLTTENASANVSTSWTPPPVPWGEWRWSPSAAGSLGMAWSGADGRRHQQGLQGSHTVSREWITGPQQALSVSVSQSLGLLRESTLAAPARSLAHGVSVFWQSSGEGGHQSFVGLSASDARNFGDSEGRFQLVNLQWSQRLQFSRHSSGSAHLTLQATKNESTEIDAFTGLARAEGSGWQRFYTASVNFEHQRLWGVPRLRWTVLAAANSQQLERRAFGDVDAPRERISESLESRLDWAVGRLETRLSARVARVDGRTVASLLVRAQRRF